MLPGPVVQPQTRGAVPAAPVSLLSATCGTGTHGAGACKAFKLLL